MIVALENISHTVLYSLPTYMNMVVILVAIVGFGVSKKEWYHNYISCYNTIVSFMESRW